jgi:effector-binding domain-containing protein
MAIEPLQTHHTEAVPAAVIRLEIPRAEMQTEFPRAIHEILDALQARGLAPAGPPFARHFRFDPEVFDFEVGFPVDGSAVGDLQPSGRVVAKALPGARVVRTIYRGPYEGLPDAWQAFTEQIREARLEVGDEFRERYVVGPEAGPDPSTWRTELSWVLADQDGDGP